MTSIAAIIAVGTSVLSFSYVVAKDYYTGVWKNPEDVQNLEQEKQKIILQSEKQNKFTSKNQWGFIRNFSKDNDKDNTNLLINF